MLWSLLLIALERMFGALSAGAFRKLLQKFSGDHKQLQICQAKKSMAFQYATTFFALIFVWFCFVNAQGRRESRFPQVRSPQMRPTRGIEHLKYNYHNMDLGTARGYGKRAVNKHYVNNFLLEWIALETRMRNLGIPRSLLKDEDIMPE